MRFLRSMARKTKRLLPTHPDHFLTDVRGVIHIGANTGHERHIYDDYRLPVIWIEPIPDIFEELSENLRSFPRQRAFRYLVTDRDDALYPFHIANNDGASSSILNLKEHTKIWPEVSFTTTLMLRSMTLPSLLEKERLDVAGFDALILDTQGSELLVLRGAEPLLTHFKYIKTEVSDFEAYENCCQVADVEAFLSRHDFRERLRHRIASHPNGGNYFDIVYVRSGHMRRP